MLTYPSLKVWPDIQPEQERQYQMAFSGGQYLITAWPTFTQVYDHIILFRN